MERTPVFSKQARSYRPSCPHLAFSPVFTAVCVESSARPLTPLLDETFQTELYRHLTDCARQRVMSFCSPLHKPHW